jgi:hypothetical protein
MAGVGAEEKQHRDCRVDEAPRLQGKRDEPAGHRHWDRQGQSHQQTDSSFDCEEKQRETNDGSGSRARPASLFPGDRPLTRHQ